jgi:hypothetical protein
MDACSWPKTQVKTHLNMETLGPLILFQPSFPNKWHQNFYIVQRHENSYIQITTKTSSQDENFYSLVIHTWHDALCMLSKRNRALLLKVWPEDQQYQQHGSFLRNAEPWVPPKPTHLHDWCVHNVWEAVQWGIYVWREMSHPEVPSLLMHGDTSNCSTVALFSTGNMVHTPTDAWNHGEYTPLYVLFSSYKV